MPDSSPETNAAVPLEVKAHRYLELDSLRGLAAFAVILGHFSLISYEARWWHILEASPARIFVGGYEAVVFFFVLSGFVLCIPFSGGKKVPYLAYLAQRLCRIYIPFAVAVLMAVLLDRLFYPAKLTGNGWIDATWTVKPDLHLLADVLLTQSTFATQVNTALWTVELEIRVSILFPLLYWIVKRSPPLLVAIATPLIPLALHAVGVPVTNILMVVTLGLFALGILLYLHLDRILGVYRSLSTGMRVLWGVLACALCWGPMMINSAVSAYGAPHWLQDDVIGVGAAGIMVAAIESPWLRKTLRHPVLLRGGALSYSLYLVHGTVLWVLFRTCLGRVPLPVLFPIFLLLAWGVTELFHLAVDAPSVFLGRTVGKTLRERLSRARKPALAEKPAA